MLQKTVCAAVLTGTVLLSNQSASLANPIEVSGDFSTKYFTSKVEGEDRDSTLVNTLKINLEVPFNDSASFYTRIGGQSLGKNLDDLKDFNTDAYEDKRSVIAFDQFGFNIHASDFDFKLGRQDATIGQTALLYSRSDSNIGKHNFVDGLSFSGKAGSVDLSGIIAKEDNADEDNKLQSIRFGQTVNDVFTYGATLAQYQPHDGDNTKHWALDAAYTSGPHTFFAEYTKSNADAFNTAYAFGWDYAFNDRTNFTITRFKVNENGDMGGQSDFDNGNKGTHYTLAHQLDETVALELVYKDQKEISTSTKNTSLEASVIFAF